MDIETRKGVSSPKAVPPAVLAALHAGTTECRSLGEWLAIDRLRLLKHCGERHGLTPYLPSAAAALAAAEKSTAIAQSLAIGSTWADLPDSVLQDLAHAHSDVLREIAACAFGARPIDLPEMLESVRWAAADAHFGVREMAWMAVRARIKAEPLLALTHLQSWTTEANDGVRRFASEATRPRGVWAAHIDLLKREPEHALALLEALRNDPSKYVRDSVANWLNDAAKTRADWVRTVCARWANGASAGTLALIKRAQRSL